MFKWWPMSSKKIEEMKQRAANKRSRICSLAIPEARQRVEALLSDPGRFDGGDIFVAETKDDSRLAPLGPIIRQFFERYDTIVHFASVLSRADIRPCEQLRGPGELPVPADELRGFVRIGEDTEGHAVVVVRPGEETVYWVSADDPPERLLGNSYPTIYHYILYWYD